MKLKLLDLFSGIGGFSLGLERSGYFETVAFCEIEEYPRKVLARHWPEVPCYGDIRELNAGRLAADGIAVDAICGGFPCQDASIAKTDGVGVEGERTGLVFDVIRLIDELEPEIVWLENVPELLNRGFGDVLGALAQIGYNAQWDCISASALGAPHHRERLVIAAYPGSSRRQGLEPNDGLLVTAVEAFAFDVHDAFDGGDALDRHLCQVRDSDGVSVAVERRRIKTLGNAFMPQIPELIGRAYGEWRAAQ